MAEHARSPQQCSADKPVADAPIQPKLLAEIEGVALVDLLPYLSSSLGLQGLACLAACSKRFQLECVDLAQHNAFQLLLNLLPPVKKTDDLAETAAAAAAAAAQSLAPTAAARRLKPLLWLLYVAPTVASSAMTDSAVLHRLLMLPAVPLAAAQQVVAAGVRIPYAQLLAAANSMAAGVEVWVQAQHSLGIAADLPAAAVAICCGQDWVSGSTSVLLETQRHLRVSKFHCLVHLKQQCCT
jgi:hypothetical protein